MVDVGLTAGVKTLWQKGSLRDYTLKVEDQEFRVHKVVLAAVSNFFQAMLCDSYVESNTDSVELKGQSADVVSKLLEFVYTGDETLLIGTDDALEVLNCAMYLQMPAVSGFCAKKLCEKLSNENCIDMMGVCMEYSFHREVEEVKNFIKLNWKKVFELYVPKEMSAHEVQAVIDNWQKSEWDMILFIQDWFICDPENHKDDVNDLLRQVRFCTFPPKQLESVREMDIFSSTEGSWHDLVEKALEYHQIPMHKRVIANSEQATLRAEPSPIIFSSSHSEDKITFCVLDKENHWRRHEIEGTNAPKYEYDCACIAVNGFLVVASYDENQVWIIFDCRTLTWSPMSKLPRPTMNFTLVHHGEYLYAIGGEYLPAENPADGYMWYSGTIPTDKVEQYSFRSDTWTSFTSLPIMMRRLPGACVLGDKLYVSGARIEERGHESVFYCLDLSSENHEWEEKPSAGWSGFPHQLCVSKLEDEEGLLVIHRCLRMSFYSLTKDTWVKLINPGPPQNIEKSSIVTSSKVTLGNSVYIINVQTMVEELDRPHPKLKYYHNFYTVGLCWKWITIEKSDDEIFDDQIENFPLRDEECYRNGSFYYCSALLALPYEMYN